jgi:hypothetical protein
MNEASISMLNSHFFPSKNKDFYINDYKDNIPQKNPKNLKNRLSIVCKKDFHTVNEIEASNIIRKIPYYSNFYRIVETYDFIKIAEINGTSIQKLPQDVVIDEHGNTPNYLILYYKNSQFTEFSDFLLTLHSCKRIFLFSLNSLSDILNSITTLYNNGICVFDVSPQNIVYSLECGEKPQISNFRYCLQLEKLNSKYFSNIIEDNEDFTYKPIELHLVYFIIKNRLHILEESHIRSIIESFVRNLSVLQFFSSNYKDLYIQACRVSLKKYLNVKSDAIINDILDQSGKWDIYGISVIYIHIFGNISRVFDIKNNIMNTLLSALIKNLHPEPNKRYSLKQFQHLYKNIINNHVDWDFIRQMPNNKLPKLFDELVK